MRWILTFRLGQLWKRSLWIVPALCAAAGVLLAVLMVNFDASWPWSETFIYDQGTAVSILAAAFGGTVSFTGFVFTMVLLLPQISGSQLSARILNLLYRDGRLKLSLGVFIGTMTYCFVLLAHIRGDYVPGFALWLAGLLLLLSVLYFLVFLNGFLHGLRPAIAASHVAAAGRRAILAVYPERSSDVRAFDAPEVSLEGRVQRISHEGEGGAILAVGVRGLLVIAERRNCVFVLPYRVGDYVATGTTILEIHGQNPPRLEGIIRRSIALGQQRTLEQDPAFAVRILVDIAAQALSPAINAPTTAVHVLDRLEDLLFAFSGRHLGAGHYADRNGTIRVVLPVHAWEDILLLALTEIRLYGANSVQVVRRLRALLEDLLVVVPEELRSSIEHEMVKLDVVVKRAFPDPIDHALASTPDRQGIGGGSRRHPDEVDPRAGDLGILGTDA